jgi:hypothetical protein
MSKREDGDQSPRSPRRSATAASSPNTFSPGGLATDASRASGGKRLPIVPRLRLPGASAHPDASGGAPALPPPASARVATRSLGIVGDIRREVGSLRSKAEYLEEENRRLRQELTSARAEQTARTARGGSAPGEAHRLIGGVREVVEKARERQDHLTRELREAHTREQRTIRGLETDLRANVERAEGQSREGLERERERLANLRDVDIVRPEEGAGSARDRSWGSAVRGAAGALMRGVAAAASGVGRPPRRSGSSSGRRPEGR